MSSFDEEELSASEVKKLEEAMAQGASMEDDGDDSDDEEVAKTPVTLSELMVRPVEDDGDHKSAHHGLHLFFTNRFEEADDFFQAKRHTVPMHATAYAVIGFLRAIFTFEPDQIAEAHTRLDEAHKLARQHAGYDGAFKSFTKMITFKKATAPTPAQLSARLNVAETKLISSVLLMLGENVSSFIKAGMGAKWAWHRYEELFKQVHSDSKDEAGTSICCSDLGGIFYGVGVFNLLLSILPRRIVRLVQFLGFKSDRDFGLSALNRSCELSDEHGGGLRAPMAAIMLLGYHVLASAFFTVPEELPTHIEKAEAILAREFRKFPDSALFLFNEGRLNRLKGDGDAAIKSFQKCMSVNSDWVQLQHLCCYELGWSCLASRDWAVSQKNWERLHSESKWSKAFYVYMKALCMLKQGNICDAANELSNMKELTKRRFSGKQIPIEQYVMRKVTDHELDSGQGLESRGGRICVLEMLYLWNMIQGLSPEVLHQAEQELQELQLEGAAGLEKDVEAMRFLILGAVYLYTDRYVDALKAYRKACEFVPEREKWVYPHAKFEIGSILLMSVADLAKTHRFYSLGSTLQAAGEGDSLKRVTEAKAALKDVNKFRQDYNFEIRLKFKMQAALRHVSELKKKLSQ